MITTMNVKEIAEFVRRHDPYQVWVGELGYDTRRVFRSLGYRKA